MVPLQLLVTAILTVAKLLLDTTKSKVTSYVSGTVIPLQLSLSKMFVEAVKRYFLYTSHDNVPVPIPKEMYKTHVKKA
jgi:hypothetical protein